MCFLGYKQQMLKIWKLWPIYMQQLFMGTAYLSEVQVSNPKIPSSVLGFLLWQYNFSSVCTLYKGK